MSQMRVSFVFDVENLTNPDEPQPQQDELVRAACVSLMEWLVEAGPSHVANFADVDMIDSTD